MLEAKLKTKILKFSFNLPRQIVLRYFPYVCFIFFTGKYLLTGKCFVSTTSSPAGGKNQRCSQGPHVSSIPRHIDGAISLGLNNTCLGWYYNPLYCASVSDPEEIQIIWRSTIEVSDIKPHTVHQISKVTLKYPAYNALGSGKQYLKKKNETLVELYQHQCLHLK